MYVSLLFTGSAKWHAVEEHFNLILQCRVMRIEIIDEVWLALLETFLLVCGTSSMPFVCGIEHHQRVSEFDRAIDTCIHQLSPNLVSTEFVKDEEPLAFAHALIRIDVDIIRAPLECNGASQLTMKFGK